MGSQNYWHWKSCHCFQKSSRGEIDFRFLKEKAYIFNLILDHRWARVLGQGGCVHTGCVQKKFSAAFGGQKIFAAALAQGCQIIFLLGGLFSRHRGDFAKKWLKMDPPGCAWKIFLLGLWHQGAHPPCLRQGGVSGDFRFLGGCAHPHTPTPCPSMYSNIQIRILILTFCVMVQLQGIIHWIYSWVSLKTFWRMI